jgi:hypothetical protein
MLMARLLTISRQLPSCYSNSPMMSSERQFPSLAQRNPSRREELRFHDQFSACTYLRLHHMSLTHDSFRFLTDFAGDLKGIALLEFRQEEFHREGTGISLVGKLIKNSD